MRRAKVTRKIELDAGHRVPDHKSKCKNFHGHRYVVEATVEGMIKDQVEDTGKTDQGMVVDFSDLKQLMMEQIHDVYDHAFMYYENDLIATVFFNQEETKQLKNICLPFIPTAECLARHFYQLIKNVLPKNLKMMNMRVYETPNCWSDYNE